MSNATGSFNELFEQAARVFENAMRAGTTMQQEATKWFSRDPSRNQFAAAMASQE